MLDTLDLTHYRVDKGQSENQREAVDAGLDPGARSEGIHPGHQECEADGEGAPCEGGYLLGFVLPLSHDHDAEPQPDDLYRQDCEEDVADELGQGEREETGDVLPPGVVEYRNQRHRYMGEAPESMPSEATHRVLDVIDVELGLWVIHALNCS